VSNVPRDHITQGLRLDIDSNIGQLLKEIQSVTLPRRDTARHGRVGSMSAERVAQVVAFGALFALEMSQEPICSNEMIRRTIERKVFEVTEHVKVMVRNNDGVIKDRG
jgi:hypothetical protein